jgi:hypothetical protein
MYELPTYPLEVTAASSTICVFHVYVVIESAGTVRFCRAADEPGFRSRSRTRAAQKDRVWLRVGLAGVSPHPDQCDH